MFKKRLLSVQFCLMAALGLVADAEESSLLKEMIEEDRSTVDALVLYPEPVLRSILEASRYPQGVVKIGGLRAKSQAAFASLVEPLERAGQEHVWELARYPELITALVKGGKKSKEDIAQIAANHPAETQEAARALGRESYRLLAEVYAYNLETAAALEAIIADFPGEVQAAYRELVGLPEVLTILQENLSLLILVGERYAEDPGSVLEKAEAMRLEAARANATAMADWKQSLEEDPEALEELKQSAEAYALEQGYDTADFASPPSSPDVTVVVRPYPYWYGYPHWHVTPYWYPYPYWYHWGFYYGPGGTVIIISTPSYRYTHWHFHHHHHHYHYPHLSHHYYRHFERHHRHVHDGFHDAVENWERENREKWDRDWLKDGGDRVEAFREYGRFEESFNKAREARPDLSRERFLQESGERFPRLASRGERRQTVVGVRDSRPADTMRDRAREPVKTAPQSEFLQRNRASDLHQRDWNQARERRSGSGFQGGGLRGRRGR